MYKETGMSLSPPGKFSPYKRTHWDSSLLELSLHHEFWSWSKVCWVVTMPSLVSLELWGWIKDGRQGNHMFLSAKQKTRQHGEGGEFEQDGATVLNVPTAPPGRLYQCDSRPPQPPASDWWSLVTTNISPWDLLFQINSSGVVLFFSFCNEVI